jgi:hypothetical protein
MADADFRKVYFIPELETKLQFCLNNFQSSSPEIKARLESDMKLIKTEVSEELRMVNNQELSRLNDVVPARFDSAVYQEVNAFLEGLKKFYIDRYNKADQKKEKKIQGLTDSPEKEREFEKFREEYHNEIIAESVKNTAETHRIIEKDGKLIQKIYPIYKDPDPEHFIDFDAQFYMPSKHFLNRNIDTFVFNTGVIWSMILALALALYFDLLRMVIDGIENLSNPINRRK